MSKFRRTRTTVIQNPIQPIPEPATKNLATGLVFLIASFFNNTQALDIEHYDKNSNFSVRYRGYSYRHDRRNRR